MSEGKENLALTSEERALIATLPDNDPAKKLLTALEQAEVQRDALALELKSSLDTLGTAKGVVEKIVTVNGEMAEKALEEMLYLQDQPFIPEDWGFKFVGKTPPSEKEQMFVSFYALGDKRLIIKSNGEIGVTMPRFYLKSNYDGKKLFELLQWEEPSLDHEGTKELVDGTSEKRPEAFLKLGDHLYHFLTMPEENVLHRGFEGRQYELIADDEKIMVMNLDAVEPGRKITNVEGMGRMKDVEDKLNEVGMSITEKAEVLSKIDNPLVIKITLGDHELN